MDARTAFKTGIGQLRDAGVPSFTLAAELLLLHVAGKDRTWLYAHPEDELTPEQELKFFALLVNIAVVVYLVYRIRTDDPAPQKHSKV